jgi:hypothetical protein
MADNPFEIPQSLRDLSEQNLKQAHDAYEQLTGFVTKAMDAWKGAMPANPMTAGFKDVQDRAMEIAMENAESAFTFAGKICNAPTPQDIHDRLQGRTRRCRSHGEEECRVSISLGRKDRQGTECPGCFRTSVPFYSRTNEGLRRPDAGASKADRGNSPEDPTRLIFQQKPHPEEKARLKWAVVHGR